jgi:SAM-dependent methyltransferase
MGLSIEEWHERFLTQAGWTQHLRDFLFTQAGIEQARLILDIGCGTGVLEKEITQARSPQVYGLDIHIEPLIWAKAYSPGASYTLGDALRLPYFDGVFDLTFCHFLLLWVSDPQKVLVEMARVTRPGGAVILLAEPDYGGRVDYPEELSWLGSRQEQSLRDQGAETHMGRQLFSLMNKAGFISVEGGVLGGEWLSPQSRDELESELKMLRYDLADQLSTDQIEAWIMKDQIAREQRERVLFVPTFYAWGRVPC